MESEPKWLAWARRLQAISQSGLAYSPNPFDLERFEQVREIAAEMMAAHSDADPLHIRGLFEGESGYATPKVDVRGVVFNPDARLLLVKEKSDGLWTLPGGYADVSDTPSEAVVREIREESGYETRAVKLLAIWDRVRQRHTPARPFRIYKLFIRCEVVGGAPADSIETEGASFFAEDAIPPLSLARTTPAQVARLFEHLRNPHWPADLD